MCTLAHIFEGAGIATVLINQLRPFIDRMRPPRALHARFPLGRPLGKPGDPGFQASVLRAAFDLLKSPVGPVVAEFPDVIRDEVVEQLACPLPARYDAATSPAVAEIRGLHAAWNRSRRQTGSTQVGRRFRAEQLDDVAERLCSVVDSGHWKPHFDSEQDVQLAMMDIRSYYEEAALALADHVPAARAVEHWFYGSTEMGELNKRLFEVVRRPDSGFVTVKSSAMLPYGHVDDHVPPLAD